MKTKTKQKINTIAEIVFFALFTILSLGAIYSYNFETDPEIKAIIFTATKILFVPFIVATIIYVQTSEIPEE